MWHGIRAMFTRVQAGGPIAKAVGGVGIIAAGFTACVTSMDFLHTVQQAHMRDQERARRDLQEAEDRDRVTARVIHSQFHAAEPAIEIPREQVQARHRKCSAAVCFVLNAPCARPRSAGCWTCMIAPPC